MSNKTAMNVSSLLNQTADGQPIPVIISSRVMEIKDFEMSHVPSEMSDKPCSDSMSSQSPPTIELAGSLDALLYIVIVLMFYAFSIVILMVKYIRREREEANLRSYYHEFVSREKFKCAQYKNRQFMKRIFSRHEDLNHRGLPSLANETRCAQPLRNNQSEIRKISRVLINTEEDSRTKESFTFLGAKSQFCKNTLFGKKFCNKQLCSICVSENVPTIDWDEDHIEKHDSGCEVNKIIEVTLHQAVIKTPQLGTQSCCTNDIHDCNSCFIKEDNIFHPIVECEKGTECNNSIQSDYPFFESGPNDVHKGNSINEHPLVSSCSLEVSELLANMPPLGISNSPSNDMDTLDGLSNLDSEIENQSLLDYSSSIRLHQDQSLKSNSKKTTDINEEINGRLLNITGNNKDDKLSDRSSLYSCSFSLDDVDKSINPGLFTPNGIKRLASAENSLNKTDICIDNGKIPPVISHSSSEREDGEMVRLLNDITVLADQSGVFKNLKYFLRGFYKSDTEDATEHSNLLPKETYFGPDSPKSLKRIDSFLKFGTNTDVTNFSRSVSPEIICSRRNHWAYTYDDDDGVISDTDQSSSFGDYCMGQTAESQIIDLSKPLAGRDIDSNVRDGLSCALIGLDPVYPNNFLQPLKQNPMVAGYGPAHKETKV